MKSEGRSLEAKTQKLHSITSEHSVGQRTSQTEPSFSGRRQASPRDERASRVTHCGLWDESERLRKYLLNDHFAQMRKVDLESACEKDSSVGF